MNTAVPKIEFIVWVLVLFCLLGNSSPFFCACTGCVLEWTDRFGINGYIPLVPSKRKEGYGDLLLVICLFNSISPRCEGIVAILLRNSQTSQIFRREGKEARSGVEDCWLTLTWCVFHFPLGEGGKRGHTAVQTVSYSNNRESACVFHEFSSTISELKAWLI